MFTVRRQTPKERSSHPHASKAYFTLDEKVDLFCNTASDLEQKSLKEAIHTELNYLSVDLTSNCPILLAESRLRNFLLQADTLQVINRIDIYASILTVMLLHGLKPHLNNKETLKSLSTHLNMIVEPPHFFPMSRVRRDVETVIKLLTAFERMLREDKIKKVTELIKRIKENGKADAQLSKNLKTYLDPQSWTQHFVLLFWLKVQV